MRYARLLLLLIGSFLASCTKPSTSKPEALRINISREPTTLDPRKARDLNDVTICHMLFEGLTRTSQTGTTELALADSFTLSEDKKEYTFFLKEAFWSNGDPVTSYDFAASWKTILDPSFPSDIAYQLYLIENAKNLKSGDSSILGIQTPDPKTLVVRLEQPTPYFLEACSMSCFFPVPEKIVLQNPNWCQSVETFVGNGPFILSSWTNADKLHVSKNSGYWDESSVKLNELELFMVSNDTEIRLFENNELDWAGSPLSTIPIDAIAALKQSGQLKVQPLSGTYFFRTNTDDTIGDKQNPLSSTYFRKALALSIDRKLIVEHVLQGGQIPAYSLVPPEMGLCNQSYLTFEEDPKLCLQIALEELNLTKETLEPITLSFVASDRNMAVAQAAQKQIEKTLGITFLLEAIESKVFQQRVKQKNFQLAVASWIADFNDPVNFLEAFKYRDGSTHNTSWENTKYIDLLEHSAVCGNQNERKQLLREAEEILMKDMPIIPVFHFAMNFLQRNGVEGIVLSPIGQVDFRWTQIEAERFSR